MAQCCVCLALCFYSTVPHCAEQYRDVSVQDAIVFAWYDIVSMQHSVGVVVGGVVLL